MGNIISGRRFVSRLMDYMMTDASFPHPSVYCLLGGYILLATSAYDAQEFSYGVRLFAIKEDYLSRAIETMFGDKYACEEDFLNGYSYEESGIILANGTMDAEAQPIAFVYTLAETMDSGELLLISADSPAADSAYTAFLALLLRARGEDPAADFLLCLADNLSISSNNPTPAKRGQKSART